MVGLCLALGAGLIQSTGVRHSRKAAGQKIVACVAVRDLMDLILFANGFHILFQNHFHKETSLYRIG